MKKLLKPISLLLIAMLLICALPLSVSAADSAIVKDGLVAYYDGSDNSAGSQDKNAERWWNADVYSIRFYDRALTADEVARNSAADNAKYRTAALALTASVALKKKEN